MESKATSSVVGVGPQRARMPERTHDATRSATLRQTIRASRGKAAPSAERGRSVQRLGLEVAIAAGPKVTDDFPDLLAVSDSELEAIEAYLSAPIEELLGRQD
jgi:hypothetical protein